MVTARLQKFYEEEGIAILRKKFSYENIMQVPKIQKIVVSVGSKDAVTDNKAISRVNDELMLITGQKPVVCRAKKSIAGFKLREGMPIGVKVTLRGVMMYEFIDKLVNIALPRVKDFRGLSPKFDGSGNYSFGIKEQLIFPEIKYDDVDKVRGMNFTFVTSANTAEEVKELLTIFDFPFND